MKIESVILNLPQYAYKINYQENKPYIFDPIRKKYISLSGEEWVRQHLINLLIIKGYPTGLIQIEKKLIVNNMSKRIDILVYNHQLKPWLLIEVKHYNQKISQRTFFQVSCYNIPLQVPLVMLSNGIKHFVYQINYKDRAYTLLDNLPEFMA